LVRLVKDRRDPNSSESDSSLFREDRQATIEEGGMYPEVGNIVKSEINEVTGRQQ
jgi:hypothetical protein